MKHCYYMVHINYSSLYVYVRLDREVPLKSLKSRKIRTPELPFFPTKCLVFNKQSVY